MTAPERREEEGRIETRRKVSEGVLDALAQGTRLRDR